jgi:hypothetical protein
MDVFLDTFRFVFPSLLILIAVYLMMSSYFDNEDRRRRGELRAQNQRQALPLRLQAYERLALFLERISPNSLVVRVKSGSLSNAEYLLLLQKSIRDEYEHNLSQQIYVSDEVWDYVTTAKSATVSLLNTVSAQLDPEAYNQTKVLYRGMADLEMDLEEFQRVGGTELAMMSTTEGQMSVSCVYVCVCRVCLCACESMYVSVCVSV